MASARWKALGFVMSVGAAQACGSGDTGMLVVPRPDVVVSDDGAPTDDGATGDGQAPMDDGATGDGPSTMDGDVASEDVPAVMDAAPTCKTGERICGEGCVDTMTNTAHCGMCDRACAATETCTAGACRPLVTCATGEALCAGTCVTTATDAAHCGMCGRACAATERCEAGVCTALRACPAGQTDCAGACTDTNTSTAHCGGCGAACPAMNTCVMGVCVPPSCPSGQTNCSGTCADLMADEANCGACGTACAAGQTCTAGRCQSACPAPRVTCTEGGSSVCVSVQTDAANCGGCGVACTNGRVCAAGACACPTGRVSCGSACVNTMTDNANCGACGTRCGVGQTCSGGMCRCPTGLTTCGSACVDTQSSLTNCGMCGRACTAPNTCNAGACSVACRAGTTLCGGSCVAVTSFQTDSANCGRCGNRCANGSTCSAGRCLPSNDNFANARVLVPSATAEVVATGSTDNATTDGPTVACLCQGSNVWFRFTLSTASLVYLDTAGSAFDTGLFVARAGATTTAAPSPVPGQPGAGFRETGLCNDNSDCVVGGDFTSDLQSRTAGILPAATYLVSLGGCSTGAYTLHLQTFPLNRTGRLSEVRLNGAGNTGAQALGGAGVTSGTCGGAGNELSFWYLSCGPSARQLFSLCRSDTNASWTRRTSILPGAPTYDPNLYVRSAQNGMQLDCNGTGLSAGATDCRGTVPGPIPGVPALDSNQIGARLNNVNTPRGLGVVFVDTTSSQSDGMRFNMRFQAP